MSAEHIVVTAVSASFAPSSLQTKQYRHLVPSPVVVIMAYACSTAAAAAGGAAAADHDRETAQCVGKVTVQELDWSQPDHWQAVQPPFDYVLAADCIYHEHLVRHLYKVVLAMTNEKSTGESSWCEVVVVQL